MRRQRGFLVALGLLLAAALPLGAAPAAARPADTVIYEVRRGDTLSDLDHAFLLGRQGVRTVARLNGLRDPDLIFTRRRLRIPRNLLRDERTRARVAAFRGQVTVERAGRSVPVAVGQDLDETTALVTGRDSFVTLRLADGSTVAIPSQTSFRILRLRRVLLTGAVEREFGLDRGRARIKVTPMLDGNSTFRVRTPVSQAAVRGTEFRAAYDADTGVASTEVHEGKVAVTTTGTGKGHAGERLLLPNFGIALGPSRDSGALPLLAAPDLVDPGRSQSGPELRFVAVPVPGATAYRAEIAPDAGLLDPLAETMSGTSELVLPAPPAGHYFVRLAAIDANGLEGNARTYSFHRRRNGLTATLFSSGRGRKARYQFKWEAEADGTPLFRFRLSRVPDGAPVVDEVALKGREIEVTALPPGEYAWRVQSTLFDEGRALESWSPEQRFVVAGRR